MQQSDQFSRRQVLAAGTVATTFTIVPRDVLGGAGYTYPPISPPGIPRPKDTPAVPPTLDWPLWVGPAPMRPYHPSCHPFA